MSDLPPSPARVLLLGATGTIGRATLAALLTRGHEVACLVRSQASELPQQARRLEGDVTDPASLRAAIENLQFDVLVSCLASRTGTPEDAWSVDHRATVDAVAACKAAGARQVVLLSAICVQRPHLAFQQAKLAAEAAVMTSGLTWSIVRPTAFFKSLSGQIDRLRRGKSFLLFGDGELTACKPISNADLADFIAGCLGDPARQNRILPVGGPGPAITPRQQGAMLFDLMGRPPQYRHVPLAVMRGIVGTLGAAGRIVPSLRAKADLARIGYYYATQSMLVLDADTGDYDADATPEHGTDTLRDHYARLIADGASDTRGDHAVF